MGAPPGKGADATRVKHGRRGPGRWTTRNSTVRPSAIVAFHDAGADGSSRTMEIRRGDVMTPPSVALR